MPKRCRRRNEVEESDRQLRPRKKPRNEVEQKSPRNTEPVNNVNALQHNQIEPGAQQLQPPPSHACNDANIELINHLTVLQRISQELSAEIASVLQRANGQFKPEAFPFMKLPPELRIIIWRLAAESHLPAKFEIIQPAVRVYYGPPDDGINGTPFRIRCPPSRRLVAQVCREARDTLLPKRRPTRRDEHPTPIWTWLDGQWDHLVIPSQLRIPRNMGYRDVLGPARHVMIAPEPRGSCLYEALKHTIESIFRDIIANQIALDSMAVIVDEFRVSVPIQAELELEFQSRFPLAINITDDSEINRVDRIFGNEEPYSGFQALARDQCRSGLITKWGEEWSDFEASLRRRVLTSCNWDDKVIESLITKGQISAGDSPNHLKAYNRLPELKRVVLLYGYWEGPARAEVIGHSRRYWG